MREEQSPKFLKSTEKDLNVWGEWVESQVS